MDRAGKQRRTLGSTPRTRLARNGIHSHRIVQGAVSAASITSGAERLATLTIHHGRHTFISHALAGGRTLADVRDAAGHSNVSIRSGYLHVIVEEGEVGSLFG